MGNTQNLKKGPYFTNHVFVRDGYEISTDPNNFAISLMEEGQKMLGASTEGSSSYWQVRRGYNVVSGKSRQRMEKGVVYQLSNSRIVRREINL